MPATHITSPAVPAALSRRAWTKEWTCNRIVELEGPARVSPDDLANAFAAILGKPVQARPVPHEMWESLFRSQGMRNLGPRIRMLDGFNEGWIDFRDGSRTVKGHTSAAEVITGLMAKARASTAQAA